MPCFELLVLHDGRRSCLLERREGGLRCLRGLYERGECS